MPEKRHGLALAAGTTDAGTTDAGTTNAGWITSLSCEEDVPHKPQPHIPPAPRKPHQALTQLTTHSSPKPSNQSQFAEADSQIGGHGS